MQIKLNYILNNHFTDIYYIEKGKRYSMELDKLS